MRGYEAFAWYYDELTENVSYEKRAEYFLKLVEKFGSSGPIVLDLACGTGSLFHGISFGVAVTLSV